jgi:hypothetical protein
MKNFENYNEAIEWVKTQSKKYTCKNEFYASEEYAIAYPEIKKLTDEYSKNIKTNNYKKQIKYTKTNSINIGDKVSKIVMGSFMMTTELFGEVVSYAGEIKVKLTDVSKQLAGKRYVSLKGFELYN